jgi:hydrogenase-1 operon protein HyaF
MPKDMAVYMPHTPEVEDPEAVGPALTLLRDVAAACSTVAKGRLAPVRPAPARCREPRADRRYAGRGRGLRQDPRHPRHRRAGNALRRGLGADRRRSGPIEVAAIPDAVRARAFTAAAPRQGPDAPRSPAVINAPPIYAELADKAAQARTGEPPHVVNFTLLPHTEDDLSWLDAALGEGAVTILSRGYGNCRVTATALAGVWRVQFFNSMDTLILDTLEVTDMPEVVLAAPEDLSDSAGASSEVLEAIT